MSGQCTDPVVGGILSGWRYDISGVAPEMRSDYEQHLAECSHCSAKQRTHRTIDIGLLGLALIAAAACLLAFGAVRVLNPTHGLLLQIAALAGFALAGVLSVLVAVATPAPVVILDAAEELKEKLARR